MSPSQLPRDSCRGKGPADEGIVDTLRGQQHPPDKPIDRILHDLQERAKELNTLYRATSSSRPGSPLRLTACAR